MVADNAKMEEKSSGLQFISCFCFWIAAMDRQTARIIALEIIAKKSQSRFIESLMIQSVTKQLGFVWSFKNDRIISRMIKEIREG